MKWPEKEKDNIEKLELKLELELGFARKNFAMTVKLFNCRFNVKIFNYWCRFHDAVELSLEIMDFKRTWPSFLHFFTFFFRNGRMTK